MRQASETSAESLCGFWMEVALKVLNHLAGPQCFAERDTEFSFLVLNIRGSRTGRRKHVVSWHLDGAGAAIGKVSSMCTGDQHVSVNMRVTTWDSLLLWPLPGLQDEPRPQGAPADTFILTPVGCWLFLWISVTQICVFLILCLLLSMGRWKPMDSGSAAAAALKSARLWLGVSQAVLGCRADTNVSHTHRL